MKSAPGVFLWAGLTCCVLTAAETAQERGKRFVDDAVAALGGDAFLHMTTRVETGRAYSFDAESLSGLTRAKIYTRYLIPPATPTPRKLFTEERQSFGKEEDSGFVLFSLTGAWEVTFRGARPLDPQRVADHEDAARRNIFYILRQRLKEPGLGFYAQPSDIYENRPINIVDITDDDGVTVTVYFDKSTKLPIRQSSKKRNTDFHDFDTDVASFSKYRDVSGVKWPYDFRREHNGMKKFEMYSDSVEIGKDVPEDTFTLSPKIKILLKSK